MNRLFFVLSITFMINVSAEELTDIQISSPVMDKATISNEAIEEVDTRNAVDGGDLQRSQLSAYAGPGATNGGLDQGGAQHRSAAA